MQQWSHTEGAKGVNWKRELVYEFSIYAFWGIYAATDITEAEQGRVAEGKPIALKYNIYRYKPPFLRNIKKTSKNI